MLPPHGGEPSSARRDAPSELCPQGSRLHKPEGLMAGSVNKVILIGNLGAKPELKYLPSGQAVTEMRLATNEVFTDKQQQRQERTEWHRVVVWGKQAEHCCQYLDKGRSCYVEGRLQTRSWDDKKTGEKKYMTEIVA